MCICTIVENQNYETHKSPKVCPKGYGQAWWVYKSCYWTIEPASGIFQFGWSRAQIKKREILEIAK